MSALAHPLLQGQFAGVIARGIGETRRIGPLYGRYLAAGDGDANTTPNRNELAQLCYAPAVADGCVGGSVRGRDTLGRPGRSLFTRPVGKTRGTRVNDRAPVVDAIRPGRRPAPWCRCVRSSDLPCVKFAGAGEGASSM